MIKPPDPYRIRSMRLSDIDAIMSIEHDAFPVPWKASAYEYEISSNRLGYYFGLTVQLGDQPAKVIGYSGFWMLADEAHISTIAVSDDWRGRGLGELLLLNLLRKAHDLSASLATLEVRKSNVVAQALYRKYQFQLVGERKRYYQGREDALIMTVKSLDKPYRSFLRARKSSLFRRLENDSLEPFSQSN
jgi:ribosomal-protein-alanine N-acetyltransferase